MKRLLMTIFLLSPAAALAQGMDQQDMQNMMPQMQEMAVCMQAVDMNEIKALEKDTEKFEAEMKGLCKDGKRDEAQEKAIEFSKKMMASPALTAMRKCTEKMAASMKGMMPNMDPEEMAIDYSKHHVCDEI
jgi:hypothetical protein